MSGVQAAAPSVRPPKGPRASISPEASGIPRPSPVLLAPWVQWLEGSPISRGWGAGSQMPWEQVGQACMCCVHAEHALHDPQHSGSAMPAAGHWPASSQSACVASLHGVFCAVALHEGMRCSYAAFF